MFRSKPSPKLVPEMVSYIGKKILEAARVFTEVGKNYERHGEDIVRRQE